LKYYSIIFWRIFKICCSHTIGCIADDSHLYRSDEVCVSQPKDKQQNQSFVRTGRIKYKVINSRYIIGTKANFATFSFGDIM